VNCPWGFFVIQSLASPALVYGASGQLRLSLMNTSPSLIFASGIAALLLATSLSAAEPGARPELGDKAPDFTLANLAGEEVTLSEVAKDKRVALIFLRGWNGYQCPACSRQTAAYLKDAKDFADRGYQVVFIYPNHGEADASLDKAEAFSNNYEYPAHFHFLTDPGVKTGAAYGLLWEAEAETVYPAFYLLDDELRVDHVEVSNSHGGRVSSEQALTWIDSLSD